MESECVRVTLDLVLRSVLLLLKFVLIWLPFSFSRGVAFETGTLGDGASSIVGALGDYY